ncbi:YczE/YyaS/YitT family protein [Corynebacterium sp. A21]|uniref:YczE/YyaS/YitT family protein n=1 Tax=Corynebacterium sp. A21 TaxID=3457318 RepID=UPI003FD497BF
MSAPKFLHHLGRIAVFTLGIFIMSLGVVASVRANLGTSPITSFPTVLSLATPLSVGMLTILLNLFFLVIEIILRGRKFPPIQLLQFPVTLIFGLFIDLNMAWTGWLNPSNYAMQWVWTIIGVLLVAVGVHIEMKPKLSYIPGDGLVTVITMVTRIKLGTVKMCFDWTLVLLSVAASFLLLGGLEGVREGTVFAAFGVGLVIKAIANIEDRVRVDRRQAARTEQEETLRV